MRRKLQRIGNSQGITLPREVLDEADIPDGSEFELKVRHRRIELVPVEKVKTLALGGIWRGSMVSDKELKEAREHVWAASLRK